MLIVIGFDGVMQKDWLGKIQICAMTVFIQIIADNWHIGCIGAVPENIAEFLEEKTGGKFTEGF